MEVCYLHLLVFESDVIVLIAKDIRRIRHFEDSVIEIVKKENLNL